MIGVSDKFLRFLSGVMSFGRLALAYLKHSWVETKKAIGF